MHDQDTLCGALLLHDDIVPIYCNEQGVCYFEDTTLGGKYEIVGFTVDEPMSVDIEEMEDLVAQAAEESTQLKGYIMVCDEEESITLLEVSDKWYASSKSLEITPVNMDTEYEAEDPPTSAFRRDDSIADILKGAEESEVAIINTLAYRLLIHAGVPKSVASEHFQASLLLEKTSTAALESSTYGERVRAAILEILRTEPRGTDVDARILALI